jgi:transposase
MSKAICWVGVDVGKSELCVAIADRRPRMFAHTKAGVRTLWRYCRRVAPTGVVHLCMESTGAYSRLLAVRLQGLEQPGLRLSIVNPACIKAFAKAQLRRTKTDAVDARVILAYAQSQCPPPWTFPSAALRELYQLVRQADAVQDDLQAWTNRAGSHDEGPERVTVVRQTDRAICRHLQRQLVRLQTAITALFARATELQRQRALLESIPGIGEKTAPRLLAYGGTVWMSHSDKELTAYAGLAPSHHQSGRSVRGKSHLAKQGNSALRHSLYMAALAAIRVNPVIRPVRNRLLDRGKTKMTAVAASMRHLLLIARAVLRNQTPFDPEYATKRT